MSSFKDKIVSTGQNKRIEKSSKKAAKRRSKGPIKVRDESVRILVKAHKIAPSIFKPKGKLNWKKQRRTVGIRPESDAQRQKLIVKINLNE